jgi:hypothetical protein
MKNPINLLKEEKINIDKLLLDPNNPRFSRHVDDMTPIDKLDDDGVQALAYTNMNHSSNRFEIDELVEAILTDGFIHVDKIFVKKIGKKYLVIEGNRRITAIKKILSDRAEGLDPDTKAEITNIPCIVVDGSDPDVDNVIRKILGLRHHGSILPWKPLPAAFNLYQEYMMELCAKNPTKAKDPNNFVYRPDIAKKVAAIFSVKWNDVKKRVKLYRVYLQLVELVRTDPSAINSDSFSMLEETLDKETLRKFFEYDDKSSTFSEDGVEKILDIYFGLRGKDPVVTEASAGSSNVRDFSYVVAEGTEEDVRRIVIDREKASVVRAEVETKRSKRTLQSALELILTELNKINLGEIGDDGFAPNEKEFIANIDKKMNKLKRAAGLEV